MEADVPPLDAMHRLKELYNFILLCDEAHSLLSIGTTGRGCLEYWNDNHPDAQVPSDLIDIRTATLSKAIGGIGGMIAGKAKFESAIRSHITQLRQDGGGRHWVHPPWYRQRGFSASQHSSRAACAV